MIMRKMPTVFVILFVFSALSLHCHADQPSVDEILKKVSDTYQDLQSYQFGAEEINDMTFAPIEPTEAKHTSARLDIMLAFVSPERFRLDVTGQGRGVLLVSDGQTRWTYNLQRNQYTEEPAIDASGKPDVPNILKSYQNLLVNRFRDLLKYSSVAVLERDDELKIGSTKVNCYVIRIKMKHGTTEIWVDKDHYIVWRSKDVRPVAVGMLGQTSSTVSLTNADLNTELEKNLFHFTAPEKAVKVSSFGPKK